MDQKEKWKHNPILHPIRYLRDPDSSKKKHYQKIIHTRGEHRFP